VADKEQIRERSDIVEIIGSFVPLNRKGKTYAGLCPFHQEKTPSFNVDPTYQTYKCFGCGEGGDVFTFIEKHENMTFVEAAEYLARRAGLTLDRKGGPSAAQVSEREKLFEMNAVAARYYAVMLEKNLRAHEYLTGRGLSEETIKRFQLGYALDNWEALSNYLELQKKDVRLAEKVGLVRRSSSGGFNDVFRNRIMFPIHDEQQRVIGFGGRAFGDDPPKYLNTGDTPLFNKSRTLYALPFARKKIGD
jgi:DNA primase